MSAYTQVQNQHPSEKARLEELIRNGRRFGVLPESILALLEERDRLAAEQNAAPSKQDAQRTVARAVAEGRKVTSGDRLALVSADAYREALREGHAEVTLEIRASFSAEEDHILAALDGRLRAAWQPLLDLAETVEPGDKSDALVLAGRADEARRLLEAPVKLRRVDALVHYQKSLLDQTGSVRDIGAHWALLWEQSPSTSKPLSVVSDAITEAKSGNFPRARQVDEARAIVADLRRQAEAEAEAARKRRVGGFTLGM